jgi:putative ABC transport system permease protein
MHTIAIINLFYFLPPLVVVGYFYYRWIDNAHEIGYALTRMVAQLLLIGYVLEFLFKNDSPYGGAAIVLFMISVSSLIALRSFKQKNFTNYWHVFGSIAIGGTLNLVLTIAMVLDVKPLYTPMVVIPLAGMIYANAMNTVAIAAERFESEITKCRYEEARLHAFKAAMIPRVNVLLAVGLVSLPGMMTGQILSGVSPLIAARYQIMVMAMVIGSSGISAILFLLWQKGRS